MIHRTIMPCGVYPGSTMTTEAPAARLPTLNITTRSRHNEPRTATGYFVPVRHR